MLLIARLAFLALSPQWYQCLSKFCCVGEAFVSVLNNPVAVKNITNSDLCQGQTEGRFEIDSVILLGVEWRAISTWWEGSPSIGGEGWLSNGIRTFLVRI